MKYYELINIAAFNIQIYFVLHFPLTSVFSPITSGLNSFFKCHYNNSMGYVFGYEFRKL